jgi:rhodanese-related sulfurtransferase
MFFRRMPSISTKELNEILNEKPLIIDVRTLGEFKDNHIPGAKNVPLDTIHTYQPKQKGYVICTSGMRSKQASKILSKKGYDVVNVKGGMRKWNGPTKGGK